MVGYRAGVLYGYDERLLYVAGLSPVLPYVQLMALVQKGPVAVEVGQSWVVLTLAASWRF